MIRRWQISQVPVGLLGLVVIIHILAARIFRESPLSWNAPILYATSAFISLFILGYLVLRRSGFPRVELYAFATLALILSGLGVFRVLQIVVVEWGGV
jgi:hypothetical protein